MERKTSGSGERYSGGNSLAGEVDRMLDDIGGKSPEEVLSGMRTASLGSSLVVASIASFAVLFVLTVVPFAMSPPGGSKPAETQANAKPEAKAEARPEEKKDEEKTAKTESKASPEAVKKLGMDEVKASDPKKNPLDNVDDLLKDLK